MNTSNNVLNTNEFPFLN